MTPHTLRLSIPREISRDYESRNPTAPVDRNKHFSEEAEFSSFFTAADPRKHDLSMGLGGQQRTTHQKAD
jgi:hypothetical protein